MDARHANMPIKQLKELCLSWDSNEEYELQEDVKQILKVLQPDTQLLQRLVVAGYKGAHFPQWMSSPSLKYLTDLELEDCKSCLQLPALGKLPYLKDLSIHNVINVKYIYEECYNGGVVFMALKNLCLRKLPNLIRLSREDGENMFPCLSRLEIEECPKFLAEEVLLQGLHSLKILRILECDKFSVGAGFQCLTCLEELWIERCREVEGLHKALQHMTALQFLALRDLPNLESLPDCFGNLPLLRALGLRDLPNLESLPGCFGNLPLLRRLYIENCSKLTCLPTSLSLSNLNGLFIRSCPELKKRCKKETGEDWPKIAHIPDILVDIEI